MWDCLLWIEGSRRNWRTGFRHLHTGRHPVGRIGAQTAWRRHLKWFVSHGSVGEIIIQFQSLIPDINVGLGAPLLATAQSSGHFGM
jgi:hypothetical protein